MLSRDLLLGELVLAYVDIRSRTANGVRMRDSFRLNVSSQSVVSWHCDMSYPPRLIRDDDCDSKRDLPLDSDWSDAIYADSHE